MLPRLPRWSRAWLGVLAATLALHALLFVLEHRPGPRRLWGDEIMYADLAERAARGEPAQIELLWPPLYPRLLGIAARLGPLGAESGEPGRARAGVALAQIALLAVGALALRALAGRLGLSPRSADVATMLFLLDPQMAAFAHYLWPETLHLALFLGLLALLARGSASIWACALAGLLLGLALLTKSLLQPFVPLLLAPLVIAHGWRRGLARAGIVTALAAAVVTPTVVDNGRRQGVFTIADSARFNLWVGLNDRAPRNFQDEIVGDEFLRWRASGATFAERDALLAQRLSAFVSERGLARVLRDQLGRQYYRLFGAPSFLTDQLPGGAIAAQGYGYVAPPAWAARLLGVWSGAHYALLLVAAAFGFAALVRGVAPVPAGPGARAWRRVVVAFVAYNLVLLLWLHVKTRYRVPLLPFFDMAAGVALAQLAWVVRRRHGDKETRTHADGDAVQPRFDRRALAFGALLAALLLMLAYGPPAVG